MPSEEKPPRDNPTVVAVLAVTDAELELDDVDAVAADADAWEAFVVIVLDVRRKDWLGVKAAGAWNGLDAGDDETVRMGELEPPNAAPWA